MVQKIVKKTVKTNLFCDIEPEKSFWLSDGKVLKNLKELQEALEAMEDSIWNYHVTAEKNDFANWIEGVFGAKSLGVAIRKASGAKAAAQKIGVALETKPVAKTAKASKPKFWSFLM
ncbi:MAG: hypothetical protein MUD10_01680 [Candidatus Pacebacteria bacterium]|jgi:hypothetical protein|nr:hypothetical protein [Candidatus Paceibacterota bacterium]